jgi:hypothetical protein
MLVKFSFMFAHKISGIRISAAVVVTRHRGWFVWRSVPGSDKIFFLLVTLYQ